jgi:RIO kinase 1
MAFHKDVDEMIKERIDKKRMKKKDKSERRAATQSVLDERTYLQLRKILQKGVLSYIEGIISAGKEANIYLGYNDEDQEVAVKIYKIDSNTSRWMRNYIVGDPRFEKIPRNISKVIYLWARKEYKNLKRAKNAGLRVPSPLYVRDNVLIMDYIGFGPIPAPLLKDIRYPKNLEFLLDDVLNFIKTLYQDAELVHGDLSHYNILYHNQKPVYIDISQAVSTAHPKAEKYLVRDIKNMFNYFERFNLELPNREEFYYDVIEV